MWLSHTWLALELWVCALRWRRQLTFSFCYTKLSVPQWSLAGLTTKLAKHLCISWSPLKIKNEITISQAFTFPYKGRQQEAIKKIKHWSWEKRVWSLKALSRYIIYETSILCLLGWLCMPCSCYARWMGRIGKIPRTCEYSRHLTTQEGCMIMDLVIWGFKIL